MKMMWLVSGTAALGTGLAVYALKKLGGNDPDQKSVRKRKIILFNHDRLTRRAMDKVSLLKGLKMGEYVSDGSASSVSFFTQINDGQDHKAT